MNTHELKKQNRRHFLKLLTASSMVCLGCGYLSALPQSKEKAADKHKFQLDSKFSFEQLFGFTYGTTIEMLRNLEEQIGREKFFSMLKKFSNKRAEKNGRQMAKNFPKNNLASFAQIMKTPNHFWKNVITFKIIEDSEKVFEIKVQECLWAKTFRKFKAEDFGYVLICHGDFAMANNFNPKLKLIRTKTLMQGHDFCNHRWMMKA